MANLGPLLIFAPRRAQAEKIARLIAQALPLDDPLHLTERQRHACGRELASVLEKRVAWHHSGLGYQARAGVVEPLAKAGKLRVVVATMGLAAGINFSMRSVLVSDTRYFDGVQEREVARDELLQMFGRAGRRGLDTIGHVIVSDRSPRLGDATPLRLKRGNELDWPPLLRVMQRAAESGRPPFAAAQALSASLFSSEPVDLGLNPVTRSSDEPAGGGAPRALFGLVPTRREILNSRAEWEPADPGRFSDGTLDEGHVLHHERLEPALENYHFVAGRFSVGRVCRIERGGRRLFGREVALAIENDDRRFSLTRNVRAWLNEGRNSRFSLDQLEEHVIPRLASHFDGGRVVGLAQRGEILAVRLDFSRVRAELYEDRHGVRLISPDEREVPIESPTNVIDSAGGGEIESRPGLRRACLAPARPHRA